MKIRAAIFTIFLAIAIALTGCAPREVIYVPDSAATKAPLPSLAEKLDALYLRDNAEWRNEMEVQILSGNTELPSRHLIHAIQAFNDEKTMKPCLEASFLYLRKSAIENGKFRGDDRKLFSAYLEYVLKHPDANAMNRVKTLCNAVQDNICQEIR